MAKRIAWLGMACLLGGLTVAAVASGLRSPVRAADAAAPQSPTGNAGDVVINEVAWMGTEASYNDEWIELYNNTDRDINLAGWSIVAADGSPDISLSGVISAHGYLLLERTNNSTVDDIPADLIYTGALANNPGAESLTLYDDTSQVIDTANGNGGAWPAGNNSTKHTMERIDPAAADTDANWADNDGITRNGLDADGAPINGTPKCRNSASSPAADLAVAFGGVPAQVDAGDRFTHTLRFRNAGNITATHTRLTNTLPAGLAFFTQTSTSPFTFGQPHTATLIWEIGDLPVSAALSTITVVLEVEADAGGVLTSALTATTSLTDTPAANNTASAAVAVREPPPLLAELAVAKTGSDTVSPGDAITYFIALSNTGAATAAAVRVTDTLPAAVDSVTQASSFTCTPLNGALVWEVGSVPTGALHTITITARATDAASGTLTNRVAATTAASETTALNNSAAWTTTVLPRVRIYALAPANYRGSGEAAALINLSPYSLSLDGWRLNDEAGFGGLSFPSTATVAAGQILWLAQDADGFYGVWGFDAHWAAQAVTRSVPVMGGSWPGFTDDGEYAYLLDADSNIIDALTYGDELTGEGWQGSSVPYKYPGHGDGQVIYRKLDQATGLPTPDTDTAADWAQDPEDPIAGRKLRYPGWDLEDLFFPAEISATAQVTLAVAPEGALDVLSRTLASARQSLRIQAYTFESVALYRVISDRIRAGVVVTILLESRPSDGMENVEKWIVHRLHRPPSSSVYFIGETAPRYRFQHAKFILVDDRLALVSTDNFGENSMPSDLKANGTSGHRGFVGATDSLPVVDYLGELFRRDCDPLRHPDVAPYDGSFAAPDPLPPVDWTVYAPVFTAPLATTATHISVLHAPEHALRDRDALLGLLKRAGDGDRIAVMQLDEPFTWTVDAGAAGLNPRLQTLVEAARSRAEVRVLLDSYYDDPLAGDGNSATCLTLNAIAAQERLSLTCRLANVTGLGIHAKLFLADVGGEKWVHLGSINGTENSNKRNREVALQLRSAEAYEWALAVFDHDWSRGHGPMIHRVLLPLVMRDYASPADYPLITEVFVNPKEENESAHEWVELYNPGPAADIAGWTLGDAINAGDFGDGRYSFPVGAQLLHDQVIVAAACATNFAAENGRNPDYEWTDCDPQVDDLISAGAWEGFGLALGNAQDEALLLRADGSLVDSVAWGGGLRVEVTPFTSFTNTIPAGFALKRYPPDTDRDDCSRDFYVGHPSPGYVSGNLLKTQSGDVQTSEVLAAPDTAPSQPIAIETIWRFTQRKLRKSLPSTF